jgi:hypothetical protein
MIPNPHLKYVSIDETVTSSNKPFYNSFPILVSKYALPNSSSTSKCVKARQLPAKTFSLPRYNNASMPPQMFYIEAVA